jgi:hypothetical protein
MFSFLVEGDTLHLVRGGAITSNPVAGLYVRYMWKYYSGVLRAARIRISQTNRYRPLPARNCQPRILIR